MKKDNFYSKLSIILTTLSSAVLNICEYVFNVSSIFVCPKNLATNVTMVAKYLGHAKIEETLNTYSHIFQNKLDDVVNTINNLNEW